MFDWMAGSDRDDPDVRPGSGESATTCMANDHRYAAEPLAADARQASTVAAHGTVASWRHSHDG